MTKEIDCGLNISKRLLEGFNSVYVIDILNKRIKPYVYHNKLAKRMANDIGDDNDYEYVMHLFADRFVLAEEKEEYLEKTRLTNICKVLDDKDCFVHVFQRYNTSGIAEYVELMVMAATEKSNNMLIMTFHTISDGVGSVKKKVIEEEMVKKREQILNSNRFLGKRTVLIVEDNEMNREILKALLEDEYNVIEAENGIIGLAIIKEYYRSLSLVLLDIEMPAMNGYDVLSYLKQDPILQSIPVIVMTANDSSEEEQKCLELGAVDFIAKPYNPRLVHSRIHNVINLRESTATLRVVEFDDLTTLYTKQAFIHHSENILRANPNNEYNIIFTDIENFKILNSQHGESKCNELLNYLGKEITRFTKGGIAGRFGGDQFVLMLRNKPDMDFSEGYLNNIVDNILQDAPINNVTIKMGVYENIDHEQPIARSCDCALLAVKKIKGVYKNNVTFYDDKMRQELLAEKRILDSMEEALEKEQFLVYYQPKHDCKTGRVAGAEALIRWIHPEHGFMSPGQFVPLFEANGFITKLDAYVIKHVCADLNRWKGQGRLTVPISINMSRRDFFEDNWIDEQMKMIEQLGTDRNLLHMEVTESHYTENTGEIIRILQKIRDFGLQIEMDDFGVGYSSLGMLTKFPINVIKLDISFVCNMAKNELVIESIIVLAHKLGFLTVAEGVEEESQYLRLKELGCDYIQGYYFSKPLSCADFEAYLKKEEEKR